MSSGASVSQGIVYTPEGAVQVSYTDLLHNPGSLSPSIEKAFGSDPACLGLIVVTDLPNGYAEKRQRLLMLAEEFSHLDEATKERFVDASSNYW